MKGATYDVCLRRVGRGVSIHAPNEGSDQLRQRVACTNRVSIHAPNEGSDATRRVYIYRAILFQSTLPMKGATWIF